MDIIANWRKGKKEHDRKVLDHEAAVLHIQHMQDQIKRRMHIEKAYLLLNPIRNWHEKGDKSLEAKHWQILAEYAQDQVRALTIGDMPSYCINTSDPTLREAMEESIIQRAEKRHGYGIDINRPPSAMTEEEITKREHWIKHTGDTF